MDQLRTFALPSALPADTSNGVATGPYSDLVAGLGQKFFFDSRFSGQLGSYNIAFGVNGALGAAGDSGKVACSSCHDPMAAGVDRRSLPNATSLGAGYTGRNSPTVINAAYSPHWQFWDGRVDSLWAQALGPPEGEAECNGSRLAVVHRIFDKYQGDYNMVFPPLPAELADTTRFPLEGKPGNTPGCQTGAAAAKEPFNDAWDCLVSADDQTTVNKVYANFGKAIAAYERKLVSNNFQPSSFDAFLLDPKANPMSDAAVRGARLFIGHAACAECHSGPMFTDYQFHNIGAPQTGEYVLQPDNGRADGVTAFQSNIFNRGNVQFSDDTTDTAYIQSLQSTSPPDSTIGQFKTPSLRNVSKTAPYMHDGAYQTLWDVVNHYNFGGETGNYAGEKDPAIAPLMLSNAELSDLVEFLQALEDGPPNLSLLDPALLVRPKLPDDPP